MLALNDRWYLWWRINTLVTDPCCHFRVCGRFAHSGVFFSFLSMIFAGFGFYFYLHRSANRNASPAESQNLNQECSFFEFFDNVSMTNPYNLWNDKQSGHYTDCDRENNDIPICYNIFQHDVWHFFSAAGVFLRFSALLVLDDNLVNVDRKHIPVFWCALTLCRK